MQIKAVKNDGLQHSFEVTISAKDLEARIEKELVSYGQTAKISGFRPGKAPLAVLKVRYGERARTNAIDDCIRESANKVLSDNKLQAAIQPKFDLKQAEPGKDLKFKMDVEVFPEIKIKDFTNISVKPIKAKIDEKEIKTTVDEIAKNHKHFEAIKKERAAKDKDQVLIDFIGRAITDGKETEISNVQDFEVELAAGQLLKEFETAIIGKKPGEEITTEFTFPEDAHETFAGKNARFTIKLKEIRAPAKVVIDDHFAKENGFETLKDFEKAVKEKLEQDFDNASFIYTKRKILDELAKNYDFQIPPTMVQNEFNAIWGQHQQDIELQEKHNKDFKKPSKKDMEKTETRYHEIAERRVRLGLLLAQIGQDNKVEVSQEELSQEIMQRVQQFSGDKQKMLEYYKKTPQAIDAVKAPLFEDKVIKFIIEKAGLKPKELSIDEFKKEIKTVSEEDE
jgi:trigger factor